MRTVCICVALAACHKAEPLPPQVDGNETFVAFPATFADFRTWASFHSDGPTDDGTFPTPVLGPRTQYINHAPAHGLKEFPVGTVIVEARESGQMLIFAGVKRGGGFNNAGALNWEWFGLDEDPASGAVSVRWRGLAPPVGGYGGIPTATCNECHEACGANNDYVCSAQLQLARF